MRPEVIYRLLFQAAWATLKAFGQDPRRLGGELGRRAVLHTWGQNLSRHVHLHGLVPGGALGATSGGGWWACSGRPRCRGDFHRVIRPGEVDTLMAGDGVVYTKHCLEPTGTVVEYLARYTHRIAITNARILAVAERQVHFRYKDYRDSNRPKTLCLDGEEFVRRFLLHILPKGLMRIRHFGFLANRVRQEKLARIRQALKSILTPTTEAGSTAAPGYPCPQCRVGRLRVIAQFPPQRLRWASPGYRP